MWLPGASARVRLTLGARLEEDCANGSPLLRTVGAFVTFTYMKIVMAQGVTSTKELRQGGPEVGAVLQRKDLRRLFRKSKYHNNLSLA